jgi:hypothetical protein
VEESQKAERDSVREVVNEKPQETVLSSGEEAAEAAEAVGSEPQHTEEDNASKSVQEEPHEPHEPQHPEAEEASFTPRNRRKPSRPASASISRRSRKNSRIREPRNLLTATRPTAGHAHSNLRLTRTVRRTAKEPHHPLPPRSNVTDICVPFSVL